MGDIKKALFAKMEAAGRSNELTFKFKLMSSAESRIVTVLNIMEDFDIFPQAKCKLKDSRESTNFRNEANRIFIASKHDVDKLLVSWELYSKAIATAPITSEELSFAYANRSGLLFCLKKYVECLEDINRALEINYPNHLKGKILLRKIECFYFLNNRIYMNNTIKEVNCWLEVMNLSIGDKKKFKEKLRDIESKDALLNPFIQNQNKRRSLPKIAYNNLIPSASDALDIQYNDKFGRHIVTTRKVNAGEILIIEKPYATMLIVEKAYTHCSHCLNVHWALIPCEFCIYAMYCSHRCKNEAWKQYHDIECSIIGYLLKLDFNKCALFSLRLTILALRESGNVHNLKSYLKQANTCEDFDSESLFEHVHQSNKYYNLYTLVTNSKKRSMSDLFEKALNAAIILYYLCSRTTLFGNKFELGINQISSNEDAIYIGGLILHNMQMIPSNIHSYEEEYNLDTVEIGTSAQPLCSLINHSCDPNVSRCSTKNGMIVFAIVPIEGGFQIFDNYGSHYAVMNKLEREEKLKQYYFKCECKACAEDWPIYKNLLPYDKLITNEKIKENIEATLKNFNTYVDCAKTDNINNNHYVLNDLSNMISTLIKYVPMPCSTVNNVIETLKRIIILTYGNTFENPKIC